MHPVLATTAQAMLFSGAMVALLAHNIVWADQAGPGADLSATDRGMVQTAAGNSGCGARPLGELTVATLSATPIVTLSANGHPVTLILDTGAERTVFTPAAADRIGAQPPRVQFERRLQGTSGRLPSHEVELHTFDAAGLSIPWHRVVVAQVALTKIFSEPLDGVLGADVLGRYDVEIDLAHQHLLFYERDSCPTGPPWPGRYTAVSAGRSGAGRLFFPIQLDRHRLMAIIDSGAQRTMLPLSVARSIGLTEATLAQERSVLTREATGELLWGHTHQFSILEVGAEIIRIPELIVADFVLPDAQIVLGVDVLNLRRIWLSYGSLQIFLASP